MSKVPSYLRSMIVEGNYADDAATALELGLAYVDTLEEQTGALNRIVAALESIDRTGVQVINQNDPEITAALRAIAGRVG